MADQTRASVAGPSGRSTQLRTVMLCDLVDSTALIERLGDRRGSDCIRGHDHAVRELLDRHGGREIDKTDGFLALFERPIQAVAFALDYQRRLRTLSEDCGQALSARVGIHVGELVTWDNEAAAVAAGAKRTEVEGLAKPVAARLMTLARPGQILLSGVAQNLAQRAQDELPPERAGAVRWLTHGRYRFKGVPAPMLVHEVGEAGQAPLLAPPSTPKAQRERPWWRSPVVLGLEAATALFALAAVLFILTRPQPAIAFAERDWVVIGDLRNLTSEPLFDDALETAFRIGLEQSRYVNVVPSLQVRDALRRMERDAGAQLDRDTAVEVALREGARAVIMPTIAEVGGRVRVSAEIVDPSSGVTVYGESADGQGVDAALPATDRVLVTLRDRLGESMSAIDHASEPLARITTGSLDALRAFALAEQSMGTGKIREALSLLDQATTIDPDFAMAYARRATLLHSMGDYAAAREQARTALAQPDKLSARERLMLEGVLSFFADPGRARERWQAVLSVYPDVAVADNNVGLAYLWFENEPAQAELHFRRFAESKSHLRGFGWFGLSVSQLALGQVQAARESMRNGMALGLSPPSFEHVLPDIVEGKHREALQALADTDEDWGATMRAERALRQAAIDTDRGAPAQALERLQALDGEAAALPPSLLRRLALARIALALAVGREDATRTLRNFIATESEALPGALEQYDWSAPTQLALAASLAAEHDERSRSQATVARLRQALSGASVPHLDRLVRMAHCQAEPSGRVQCLARLVDGQEYFGVHVALEREYRKAGRDADAQRELQWMRDHRGRAVTELQKQDTLVLNLLALFEAARAQAGEAAVQDAPAP